MQKLKGNWRLLWLIFFVLFFISDLILDYCFGETNFSAHHLIQRAVSCFVSGFIVAMLLTSINPFKKKQKKEPESEKAG